MHGNPPTGPPAQSRARWRSSVQVSARYVAASDKRRDLMRATTEQAFDRLARDQARMRRGETALHTLADAIARLVSPGEWHTTDNPTISQSDNQSECTHDANHNGLSSQLPSSHS